MSETKEIRLTAEAVEEVFEKCLFKDDEIVNGKPTVEPIKGLGVIQDYGFHPERLEENRDNVLAFLGDLPTSFKETGGGGMSFLNACMDKNDHQWGGHRNMDQLFTLGNALKLVVYPIPRSMWSILPGGMPYVTVKL